MRRRRVCQSAARGSSVFGSRVPPTGRRHGKREQRQSASSVQTRRPHHGAQFPPGATGLDTARWCAGWGCKTGGEDVVAPFLTAPRTDGRETARARTRETCAPGGEGRALLRRRFGSRFSSARSLPLSFCCVVVCFFSPLCSSAGRRVSPVGENLLRVCMLQRYRGPPFPYVIAFVVFVP